MAERINIIDVTTDNVHEAGIYCIKDKKSPGYHKKVEWFRNKINKGLKIKIVIDNSGKQLGFIEWIPSELAWRPVKAVNYLFIQCIGVFVKKARNQNIGTALLNECEHEAVQANKSGICVMTSDGPWIANRTLFEKNGFMIANKLDRFELMYKRLNNTSPAPQLKNWNMQLVKYEGWNLIYADQCPWHEKSVKDISQSAAENGIKIMITKLTTPEEAQNAPSGFGTFALVKDGRLLADHYISGTRFGNILKQEKKESN